MAYTVQDRFFLKAKKEHYLARAVYKLEEIQKKHRILRAGDRILDLGAAPGSWIQLASKVAGRSGLVVGIDLKPIERDFGNRVITIQGDIFDLEFVEAAVRDHLPFDVVLSDMAPATSGIKVADSARSSLLFERAFEIARWALKPGGNFLAKIFHGPEFHRLLTEVKKEFGRTRAIRPDATRKQSREIYILGTSLRSSQKSQKEVADRESEAESGLTSG
jgi:23S rRNA (uridine2552-2'-O)-methyltransferase